MNKVSFRIPQIQHATQGQIWTTTKIIVTVVGVLALFSNDFVVLFSDAFLTEEASYLLAIPFIFVYMLYRKRRTLRAVIPLDSSDNPKQTRNLPPIAGALLVLTAILLYWHGSYTFTPLEYHMAALPLFASGLVLLLFNSQTLYHLAFPIAFLFFLVPPPSEALYTAGSILSTLSAQISNAFVSAIGVPSTLVSEYGSPLIQIARPDQTTLNFTVDIACSGIYSLIGFAVFSTLIAYIIRDKPWKKLALILSGIPIIYFFNVLRITILLLIGYSFGENLALEVFHALGGWVLIFIGTLLLLLTSEKVFKTQLFSKVEKCAKCNPIPHTTKGFCYSCGRVLKPATSQFPKIDTIKTVAVLFSVISLAMIQPPVFALTQSPDGALISTPVDQQTSTRILPEIPGYTLLFNYRDYDFEEFNQNIDMALVYIYVPDDRSLGTIWVAVEIASARSPLHQWETCLVNYPLATGLSPMVTQLEMRDIQLCENPSIVGRYFAFSYLRTTGLTRFQTVIYWYEKTSFNIDYIVQQKYVKMSLIAYPDSSDDLSQIESSLIQTAKSITDYWQPIKSWSPLTLVLSQSGAQLAASTNIIFMAAVVLYGWETRRQKNLNRVVYGKLSDGNKQIIDIVRKTGEKDMPTLENIANMWLQMTGQSIDRDQLLQKLVELEKAGAINSYIANKQDEPFQTWKP